MTDGFALFASPLTWMIFGGVAQFSLAGWVRAPKTLLWAAAPGVMIISFIAARLTVGGDVHAVQAAMGFGLLATAMITALAAPAAMNTGILLAITTTFWFSLFAGHRPGGGAGDFLWIVIATLPTFALLGIVATNHRPARELRLALYLWALLAMVVVGVKRFPYSDFAALETAGLSWIVILAAAYLGAHVAMLAHNVLSLFILLPFAGDGETFRQRVKDIKEHAARLIACYSPEPVGPGRALAVIAGQGAFIWLLTRWRLEGVGIAVQSSLSLCLVASIFFARPVQPERPERLPTGGDIKREMRRRRSRGSP